MWFFCLVKEMYWTKCLDEEMHTAAPNFERPSEYLRGRCPLCFGGNDWNKPNDLYVKNLTITVQMLY